MVTYALDTSAYFRFLDREAGGARVADIFQQHVDGKAIVLISAIHWGEVDGLITKRKGPNTVAQIAEYLRGLKIFIVPATAERAERAALIAVKYRIPYADAFGVELASDSADHVLVTADFDVKPAEQDIRIEFLPTKPKP